MLLTLLLIFLLGYIGYRIFSFLHIPGGAVTGSLAMVALVTSLGAGWSEMPAYVSTFFQVIVGVMLGCKFSKERMSTMKSLFIPGMMSSVWMICFSLIIGLLLAKFTNIELGSALFGSVPGGLYEMGLIAITYNLSVPVVALFQFVRVISVSVSVPVIVSKFNHIEENRNISLNLSAIDKEDHTTSATNSDKYSDKGNIINILASLLVGGIGGFTAKHFGLPVGGLLGAMLTVGIFRIMGAPLKELPRWLIICAQISLGAYLGTTFTPEMVATLKSLVFPILIFSMVIVSNGIFIGFLIHRIFGWDLTTSLLATAAGGVTLMTITALEMNADSIKVSIFHVFRLVIILLLMPTLIAFIIG